MYCLFGIHTDFFFFPPTTLSKRVQVYKKMKNTVYNIKLKEQKARVVNYRNTYKNLQITMVLRAFLLEECNINSMYKSTSLVHTKLYQLKGKIPHFSSLVGWPGWFILILTFRQCFLSVGIGVDQPGWLVRDEKGGIHLFQHLGAVISIKKLTL